MIKYGINVELLKRLIDKTIIEKSDLFTKYEINFDDNGTNIYIFITFYFDNVKLKDYEEQYYEKLTKIYGDLNEVPDEDYRYFDDYVNNEILYVPIHKLVYSGLGLDRKKYRLSIESVE